MRGDLSREGRSAQMTDGAKREKRVVRSYSAELKAEAIELSRRIGPKAASLQLDVGYEALRQWRRMNLPKEELRQQKVFTKEFKAEAVEFALQVGTTSAAEKLGVGPKVLHSWKTKVVGRTRADYGIYTDEIRKLAVSEANEKGMIRVALERNIPEGTLANWMRQAKGNYKKRYTQTRYSRAFKEEVLKRIQIDGVQNVCAQENLGTQLVRTWVKKAGVADPYEGVKKHSDKTLSWVDANYSEWRELAVEWLKGETRSIGGKINALRVFFNRYLIECLLPSEPHALLSRNAYAPDFFKVACAESRHGQVVNNFVHKFIDWVLLLNCSETDDYGYRLVSPAFRNPVKRISMGGVSIEESVYTPLPYGFISELRHMLAAGENFADWVWAHQAIGKEEGKTGSVAPDWFAVSESQIDRNDPDCVWRVRMRGKTCGGEVLEMWSPVRWVALLIKLILPLRTMQVRVLDSGEADAWRYELSQDNKSTWVRNEVVSRFGIGSKTAQGVFRRIQPKISEMQELGGTDVQLYINTNKTADLNKTGSEKGYLMPWVSPTDDRQSNPFYWLHKLRNWQEKFNPISKRTSWKELDHRHIKIKSDVQLASYADSCFLFRLPEAKPLERHFPVSSGHVDLCWQELLRQYEQRLANLGRVQADGSPIRLVDRGRGRAFFPLHALRVSLITALALDGSLSFPIIQKLVGHSRLLMTLYYTKAGAYRIRQELGEASRRLDAAKERSIAGFLLNTEYDKLIEEAICNSATTFAKVIPMHKESRNAAGWMPMHHGLCLVGGNTSPLEGTDTNGCHNGGTHIGTTQKNLHTPVPGGARNCVRCRWFVTEPHHLPALVAHFNNIMYHFDEARMACVDAEKSLAERKLDRKREEDSGRLYLQSALLQNSERVWESCLQKFNDLAEDAAATSRLIKRCIELLDKESQSNPQTLLATGTVGDVSMAIEETSSELLQLTGVCEAAEIYADLAPGKAVFRRSQLLDAALHREGMPPVFMVLSESEQLRVGNAFMKKLYLTQNLMNVEAGKHVVISLIDEKKNLYENLGIKVSTLFEEHLLPEKISISRLIGRP